MAIGGLERNEMPADAMTIEAERQSAIRFARRDAEQPAIRNQSRQRIGDALE